MVATEVAGKLLGARFRVGVRVIGLGLGWLVGAVGAGEWVMVLLVIFSSRRSIVTRPA
jgi:hypothetical protein